MRININIVYLVIILFVFGSCTSINNKKQIAENKKWKTVLSSDGSEPIQRHEAAFVKVGSKFYLLGGRGIRPVSIFDTENKTWSTGTKPPMEFHHFQPVVFKDKVYVIGAMTGKYPGETPVPYVYYYDTNDDSWHKSTEIPEERRRGSTGNALNGTKVYITCGIVDGHRGGHQKWFDSFDLESEEWTVLPDAPRARDHFQAVYLDNKIYSLAGRLSKAPKKTFSETIAEVDVFDLEKMEWSTLEKNLPTKRAGNIAIAYKNEVLVIGGESATQELAHSEVEGLDSKKHEWKTYPSLVEGRHGTGALIFNNQIYIASGCGHRGGSPELKTMEQY